MRRVDWFFRAVVFLYCLVALGMLLTALAIVELVLTAPPGPSARSHTTIVRVFYPDGAVEYPNVVRSDIVRSCLRFTLDDGTRWETSLPAQIVRVPAPKPFVESEEVPR